MPVEDPAHNFSFSSRITSRAGSPSDGGNFDIAVRSTGDDRALAGPPQLAAAVAFYDLGALELGHRRLDLGQQPAVRVVGQATFDKDHRDPEAGELVEHQRLVHVVAGQAIGAQHDQGVDGAGGGSVPGPVEARAVERGAAVAVIGAASPRPNLRRRARACTASS